MSRKVMKSCPASRFELANPLCLSAIPLGAVAAFQHGQLGLVVGKGSGYLWFIPAEGKVSLESTHGEELLAGHALSIRTYLKHQKYKWNLISHDPNIYIEAVTRTFGPTGGFPGDRVEILVLTVH